MWIRQRGTPVALNTRLLVADSPNKGAPWFELVDATNDRKGGVNVIEREQMAYGDRIYMVEAWYLTERLKS